MTGVFVDGKWQTMIMAYIRILWDIYPKTWVTSFHIVLYHGNIEAEIRGVVNVWMLHITQLFGMNLWQILEGTLVGCFAPKKKDMWGGPFMGLPPNGWFIRENPTKIGWFRDAALSSLVGFWLELVQCLPLLLGSPINPEIVLGKTSHVITVCICFLFFLVGGLNPSEKY